VPPSWVTVSDGVFGSMPKYEKAVRFLMKDMVNDLGMDKKAILSKKKTIDWFKMKYPEIDQKTVECHLTRMSTNAPSRLHFNAVPREDDLLFKIDSNHFRLFDPQNDPDPIWSEKQAPTVGSRKQRKIKNYQPQISNLIDNLETLHNSFYAKEVFTGPSLYFHGKALDARHMSDNEQYLEYIYATLVSWGMHRMGSGGSKMLGFEEFKNSVDGLKDEICAAQNINIEDIAESDWAVLEKIFKNLKIMKTGTSLVGNSKVMAHMMANIVPPIDRAYTLRYLEENVKNGFEHEWPLMRNIIEKFFIPVATDKNYSTHAKNWMGDRKKYPWDSSPFKIIDNLIIAAGYRRKPKRKGKMVT
jgi:hypothetical protein